MKKKKNIIITLIIVLVVSITIITALVIYLNKNNNSPEITKTNYKKGNFTKLPDTDKAYDDIESIITSKDQLEELFPNNNLNLDFDNYNYLVFGIMYDSCSEENIKPTKYDIKNKVITVVVNYDQKCGLCAPQNLYYLLQIDKSITEYIRVDLSYVAKKKAKCPQGVAYKPMIYLYPEEETNVKIELGNPNYLTTTYPKYNNGWDVIAEPDGTIKTNDREYYGLFWEGNNHQAKIKDDGFIIKGKDTEKFLEEKLNILGLTNKEANEFIIYWLPKLEKNKYNYIRFETLEEINNYMPLSIEPEPNTIIRIQMDYKPLNKSINVKEQQLKTIERNGFILVEWGGSQIA